MVRRYVPRKVKPRRPFRVSTWVTDAEKTTIETAATISGESIAFFIRRSALNAAHDVIADETETIRTAEA